jgi:hypothetical protein
MRRLVTWRSRLAVALPGAASACILTVQNPGHTFVG